MVFNIYALSLPKWKKTTFSEAMPFIDDIVMLIKNRIVKMKSVILCFKKKFIIYLISSLCLLVFLNKGCLFFCSAALIE